LQAWQQRWQLVPLGTQNSVEYVCELKIDGSALAMNMEFWWGQLGVTGLQEKILLKMCEQSAQFPALNLENLQSKCAGGVLFAGVSTNQSGAGDR